MRFWIIGALLVGNMVCFGQQLKSTGKAVTSGACSPAVSGSGNTFRINCKVDAERGKQIIAILNKILANQIESAEVNAKLDEILAQKQKPSQFVNAPNGIGTIGGTLVNPVVNNYEPQAKINWTVKVLDPVDGKARIKVRINEDHVVESGAIGFTCSAACHIVDVKFMATGMFSIRDILHNTDQTITIFVLWVPKPIPPGTPFDVIISSDNEIPPVVVWSGPVPQSSLPQ